MSSKRASRLLALFPMVVVVAFGASVSPASADPRVPTQDDGRNKLAAQGRTFDQMTHPDFLARQAQAVDECLELDDAAKSRPPLSEECFLTDPYRLNWSEQARGQVRPVSWENRYGVNIVGHLWAPSLDASSGQEQQPLPSVLVVNGGGGIEQQYWALAQGLAESGYLVLTFDPQCHGRRSGCKPKADPYCHPDGEWRKPQEMGVVEHGACAGNPPHPFDTPASTARHAAFCVGTGECDQARLREDYVIRQSGHVLGALDAVEWLLSDNNDWRHLVDPGRVGIAGHSLGGQAALLAGNGDPLERFSAAVSWDGYGVLPFGVPPRIPTLFQRADHDEYVRTMTPDPDGSTPLMNARQFADAGVPTAHIALGGGSTHQEWAYTPFYGAAQAGQSVASRDGERVALHYTLAWFDRFLRGPADDARQRLLSPVFDKSADASSIGQGSYDIVQRRNVPYTIVGETTAEHLSRLYPSSLWLPEVICPDLLEGCRFPASR